MARNKYEFNAKVETNNMIKWLRKYFAANGPDSKAVIGISGGKDSTIVAALCVEALGKDRVYGVLMPQGVQHDIEVAENVCKWLGIDYTEVNIGETCVKLYDAIMPAGITHPQVLSNTPARIRMSVLYAVAALVRGRVACTSNASENYIGYSTKYGDHAGDFAPLTDYTVTELLAIGEVLKVPNEFLYKTPEDGLSGKTDEDNIGFTYKELDKYIREDIVPEYDHFVKIQQMHKASRHKDKAIQLPHPYRCTRYDGYDSYEDGTYAF